ncbi:MAG: deoxyribodipyrimidine photo-lyase [Bacteroidetes bacterium]|nr:deoxyribodipyrimidine photo-lyase [Bacteroidota bacterium]
MASKDLVVFWFRRDLRLDDNTALYHALSSGKPVLPIFIFDRNILDKLEHPSDLRVQFIHQHITSLNNSLEKVGSGLNVYYGNPVDCFSSLLSEYPVSSIITNHDYEPYAIDRDQQISDLAKKYDITFQTYKDHVIFEKKEVCKDDGTAYTVFTPYSRKWKAQLAAHPIALSPSESLIDRFHLHTAWQAPSLNEMGFNQAAFDFPSQAPDLQLMRTYDETRNFPALNGTTRLGVHLRFGTISIRKLSILAGKQNETFLNELIWRDFYHMILDNFPHVGKGQSFKKEYDRIQWRNNEHEFEKWCNGMTGYPIVDAGMRELAQTGHMHNRLRMITASFLTKHLLIDWRWGESWFASKLLDFDFASNNGGWQWASGSGCDAAPYFRIFNPALQTAKFDSKGEYIRRWVPEWEEFGYPLPVVEHEFARKRCLETYAKYLGKE